MNDRRVLHSDERGKRGSVPQFPESLSGEWEEIWFLWHGGVYVREKYGEDGDGRLKALFALVSQLNERGDIYAKNLLGVLYELGWGVLKDDIIAAGLYRDAALTEELRIAWYNLGMNYWRRNLYFQALESFFKGRQRECTWCEAWLACGSA